MGKIVPGGKMKVHSSDVLFTIASCENQVQRLESTYFNRLIIPRKDLEKVTGILNNLFQKVDEIRPQIEGAHTTTVFSSLTDRLIELYGHLSDQVIDRRIDALLEKAEHLSENTNEAEALKAEAKRIRTNFRLSQGNSGLMRIFDSIIESASSGERPVGLDAHVCPFYDSSAEEVENTKVENATTALELLSIGSLLFSGKKTQGLSQLSFLLSKEQYIELSSVCKNFGGDLEEFEASESPAEYNRQLPIILRGIVTYSNRLSGNLSIPTEEEALVTFEEEFEV